MTFQGLVGLSSTSIVLNNDNSFSLNVNPRLIFGDQAGNHVVTVTIGDEYNRNAFTHQFTLKISFT